MRALLFLFLFLVSAATTEAAFTIKDGWIADANTLATRPVEEHYHIGLAAMEHSDWKEAAKQFHVVSSNFPQSSFAKEAFFYLGVANFHLEEYDFANNAFSEYLRVHQNPQRFEEAIEYKFKIANLFKNGAKRHFFGTKHLPKWASGRDVALEIYDQIIAAVPAHELAAQSLFGKADLLCQSGCYVESIDVYQQLIRKFPKHELAPKSYVAISAVYLERSQYEQQNPDLLALAQINLRRFQQEYPRDESIEIVEKNLLALKECCACSLYDIAQFYERTDHPRASIIYYKSAISQFPETAIAGECEKRLAVLTHSQKK